MLTAEGDRAFCTGADINAWSDLPPAEFARHWVRDGHRIFDRLARLSKPTIAALNPATPSVAGWSWPPPATSASLRRRRHLRFPKPASASCPAGPARSG
jgi:hypothetical protein